MTSTPTPAIGFDDDIAETITPLPDPADAVAADLARTLTDLETFALVRDINSAPRAGRDKRKVRAAVEFAVRRHFRDTDPDAAETIISMWAAGLISITARTVGADKGGSFEYADGDCFRGNDPETTRQFVALTFHADGWTDADGTRWKAPR